MLQKEEELRKLQSLAAEMEEDLNRALQEKQVSISCVEENIPSSFSWQIDNVIMNYYMNCLSRLRPSREICPDMPRAFFYTISAVL